MANESRLACDRVKGHIKYLPSSMLGGGEITALTKKKDIRTVLKFADQDSLYRQYTQSEFASSENRETLETFQQRIL